MRATCLETGKRFGGLECEAEEQMRRKSSRKGSKCLGVGGTEIAPESGLKKSLCRLSSKERCNMLARREPHRGGRGAQADGTKEDGDSNEEEGAEAHGAVLRLVRLG